MSITLTALQKQRTDTAANWTSANPTLLAGELGFESDTGKVKLGTGSTAWTSLGYLGVIPSSGTYPLSQLIMPLGTAGAPSLTFVGDLDTGIYSPGANQVALSVGGSDLLFISSTGNVGIGTNSPPSLSNTKSLSINGTNASILDMARSGASNYRLINDSTGTRSVTLNNTPLTLETNAVERVRITGSGTLNFKGAGTAGSTQAVSFNGSAPVNSLVIDSSGRVGVGTSTPGATLETASANVSGDDNIGNVYIRTTDALGSGIGGKLTLGGLYNATSSYAFAGLAGRKENATSGNVAGYLQFLTTTSAGALTERLRIDSSGRLLVGTSTARNNVATITPGLQIEGLTNNSNRYTGFIYNSADVGGPEIHFAKSRGTSIGSNTVVADGDQIGTVNFEGADGTNFIIGAQIRAFVDGTPGSGDMPGRLVFSTTADGASSPTSRLVIKEAGDIVIPATSATKGLWIGTGDAAGNGASANYRIGQNSSGAASGTLYIGNSAIQVSSDIRLKENIESTTLDALDALSRVSVKDFTWNDPSDTSLNNRNARGKWTGLIAQEIVEILPFVVNAPRDQNGKIDHDSESIWTLDQSQLCPVLIKAIQQQQLLIASLETRLSALEA